MSDLLIVVGARPNFMKAASIVHSARRAGLICTLLHTGQHYDAELSQVFFDELKLPPPEVSLGVGSGSHASQTARIMLAFEQELDRIKPGVVVVVGDVNSTLACALVAVKEHYPVAHVEAGLRCYDPWMPEEINRRLCDHMSAYLFTTSRDANENLAREDIDGEHVFFVGNTMIDTLLRFRDAARARETPKRFGLKTHEYGVLTLHRPDNVDEAEPFRRVLDAVALISRCVPVVFPVHPRTRQRLEATGLDQVLAREPGVITCSPLGYLDFVGLVGDAALVLTDSGGIQEETTVLGVPCLTLRESTERPVTVTSGTNIDRRYGSGSPSSRRPRQRWHPTRAAGTCPSSGTGMRARGSSRSSCKTSQKLRRRAPEPDRVGAGRRAAGRRRADKAAEILLIVRTPPPYGGGEAVGALLRAALHRDVRGTRVPPPRAPEGDRRAPSHSTNLRFGIHVRHPEHAPAAARHVHGPSISTSRRTCTAFLRSSVVILGGTTASASASSATSQAATSSSSERQRTRAALRAPSARTRPTRSACSGSRSR